MTFDNWLIEIRLTRGDDEKLANMLLSRLNHYRGGSKRTRDVEEIMSFLEAVRTKAIMEVV